MDKFKGLLTWQNLLFTAAVSVLSIWVWTKYVQPMINRNTTTAA